MSINAGTGVITGTPSATGTVHDRRDRERLGGRRRDAQLLGAHQQPALDHDRAHCRTASRAAPTTRPSRPTQGTPPYAWAASGLPSGMAINATYRRDLGHADRGGPFSITHYRDRRRRGEREPIAEPRRCGRAPAITGTLPNGAVGVVYSATLTSTGGRRAVHVVGNQLAGRPDDECHHRHGLGNSDRCSHTHRERDRHRFARRHRDPELHRHDLPCTR